MPRNLLQSSSSKNKKNNEASAAQVSGKLESSKKIQKAKKGEKPRYKPTLEDEVNRRQACYLAQRKFLQKDVVVDSLLPQSMPGLQLILEDQEWIQSNQWMQFTENQKKMSLIQLQVEEICYNWLIKV